MKAPTIAALVAVALAAGSAAAQGTAPAKGTAQEGTAVQYPSVPSKYLRPQKTDAEKQKADAAVAQLSKNAEKKANQADDEPQPRLATASVGQVSVNSNTEISMLPGQNVFIPISREHPNRLLTPFKNPQVISTSLRGGKKGECGEVCVRDSVIYITTDSPSAVTAFITEKGHEDIAFSVTMVPQAIPPREVRFTFPNNIMERLNSRAVTGASSRKAQAWETSQPYVNTIRAALRGVALGEVPSGYNLRKIRVTDALPTCKHPGLDFKWEGGQLLEGYNLDIYVGVIKNITDGPIEFRNQNCGGWRTAAVTSWPLTVLKPGQQTELYVVVKRQDETPAELVRKPLIEREFN